MPKQLVILNAVVAEIKKTDGIFNFEFGSQWSADNEHALNFVVEVEQKFGRKTKTYGFLNVDRAPASIPSILTRFNEDDDDSFSEATTRMMNRLKSSLNTDGRGNTTVGHVVFIHYGDENQQDDLGRLLVVMVDKKDVFDFGAGLVPTQFKSIDVDTLRQAVTYDLTLFNSVYPEHVAERQEEAYLQFIKGRSAGQFFQEAFGTDKIVSSTVSMNSIFEAVVDFCDKLDIPDVFVPKVHNEIELLVAAKKHKEISVASIARKVVSALPEGCCEEELTTEIFIDFLNEGNYQVSEVFDITRGELEKVTSIEGKKGLDYYYKVKKSAVGSITDDEKSVRYNPTTKVLSIEIEDEDEHNRLVAALNNRV